MSQNGSGAWLALAVVGAALLALAAGRAKGEELPPLPGSICGPIPTIAAQFLDIGLTPVVRFDDAGFAKIMFGNEDGRWVLTITAGNGYLCTMREGRGLVIARRPSSE